MNALSSVAFCHAWQPLRRSNGAMLAPPAQDLRMRRNTGFFRGSFAGGLNYASFGAWKSSFAK